MQLEYVNINPPQPMDKLTVDGGNGNGSGGASPGSEGPGGSDDQMGAIFRLRRSNDPMGLGATFRL